MDLFSTRKDRLSRARLYAIVDLGYVTAARVPAVTAQLVEGGVDLIQLRAKKLTLAEIAELGAAMRATMPADGPLFILNDHPELVPKIGADGIHVGQDDLAVPQARELAGTDVLVGKSTHSLDQAIAAEREGADYIGVGPIFATPTKPDYVPVGPGLIRPVRERVQVPQFCIGGVNQETLPEVLKAGALRVVIVSALLGASDIAAYCRRVRKELKKGEDKPPWWRPVGGLNDAKAIREVRGELSRRPQLDPRAFAAAYFPPEKREIAARLWELTQKHSIAKIEGIVPEDRFVQDLRMDDLDSMSLVELVVDIENAFQISIHDETARMIRNFGQLVEAVYRLKKGGGTDSSPGSASAAHH